MIAAAHAWTTNGHLIEDVASLGYLTKEGRTLDPTFGLGTFWKRWRPDNLTATDILIEYGTVCVDFRSMPWADDTFDQITLDPPYKLNGTPTAAVDHRYGVDVVQSWQERHQLIRDGIVECSRVLKRGGHLLLKCQDQVSSGKVRWQTFEFASFAGFYGLDLVDRFDMLGTSRAQPSGRRQVHAHGRPSTLLVFEGA